MVWAADIQPRVLQRTIGARVQRAITHAGASNTRGAIFKGTSPLAGFDVTRLQEVEVETLVHRKDLQGRCADHQRILLPDPDPVTVEIPTLCLSMPIPMVNECISVISKGCLEIWVTICIALGVGGV